MKTLKFSILAPLLLMMAVMLFWQGQLRAKLRQENQTLRLRIAQLEARNEELSRDATGTSKAAAVSEEELRELLKLREGESAQSQFGFSEQFGSPSVLAICWAKPVCVNWWALPSAKTILPALTCMVLS